MSVKYFKLSLTYYFNIPEYSLDNSPMLCFDRLAKYFELSDKPNTIYMRLSTTVSKDSYLVEKIKDDWSRNTRVLESDGNYTNLIMYGSFWDLVEGEFGTDSIYISIYTY